MESIKKLYKSSGKFNVQQHYKAIFEVSMVSTTEVFMENSPMTPGSSVIFKKPSARKSLCKIYEVFNFKQMTSIKWLGPSKSKRKEIRSCSTMLLSIPKRKGHTKIHERLKRAL